MNHPLNFIQIVIALGLLNVWFVRPKRKTPYRGGEARSMAEEFAVYGLPPWSLYVIGTLKVGAALFLIAGLWWKAVVLPAAALVTTLMVGALTMHWKVRDPIKKYGPAFIMFLLSLGLCLGLLQKF